MRDDDSGTVGRAGVRLDSAKLRCLAHPLRLRLLSTLRLHGPATSAGLAKRLGTNTGATSYHLRQLADVGLVTEDEDRGTARERWWQAAHEFTSWSEAEFDDDPNDRAASEWLLGQTIRLKSAWRDRWFATRRDWSADWRDAAESSDLQIDLTPRQLRAMNDELLAVVRRYQAAGPIDGDDVQPVVVLIDSFPAPDLSM
jgi:DNA-binding transcriptional ArsR family regulator